MNKPAILLAFANEREEGQRYLRNLPLEMTLLRSALEKAEDRGLCELVILPNTTLDNLIDTFQREKYRNRIAIFHYGGHAGSYELLLEQADGKTQLAHGQGLVPFLAGQKSLQLVFLNGCHSARQAEDLINNGVPAVVGTVGAVDDRIASELASAFYKAMGEGMPLEQAWQEAAYRMKAGEGAGELSGYYQKQITSESNRDMIFDLSKQAEQFPWEIHYRPGAEAIRDWNLPDAANDPYFGLPGIPARYGFPEEPYRFLERYAKKDARIFFGRGSYIRDLYHRIHSPMAAPAILLYGQSGVGKSSLLEAGLFPRLEEGYDIRMFRRQPETGLLGHLAQALEIKEEKPGAAQLLKQWKHLEAQSEKTGLIIMLDQVEEVFTRPAEGQPEELNDFLQTASAIFARPDERPIGKLVLSYRKEYDPEIEKACRIAALPKEKVFLERLDRKGILEIAGGLSSNPQLQNKYRLEIEKELPALIADDLLEDRNSPIAPVLQIILTKLWQQQEGQDKRSFRTDDYQKLKKEGILLDDFFQQQMAQIRAWEEQIQQKVKSSGLALDVLHYHTTPLGTAESRDLETLRTHYQHQSDVLQQLLQQLQSLYLLAGLGPERTALAHDTLAPIVQREIRDSDKPGQRALRILSSKIADYDISPERTYIDEEDLALVEEGAGGMRMWTGKEKELVKKSRERRAKLVAERKRNRQLKVLGVLLITAFAIVASLFWWQSSRQSKVNELVGEARRMERTDATKAFDIIQTALKILPDDRNALQARHDIYSYNEFYSWEALAKPGESLAPNAPINAVDLSPDGQWIVAAVGNQAILWSETGQKILSFDHQGPVNDVHFSPDGRAVLTASDDETVKTWDLEGKAETLFQGHNSRLKRAVFSADGQRVLTGGQNGTVFLWGRNGDKLHSWKPHTDSITTLAFTSDGNHFITGGSDSLLSHWQWNGEKLERLHSFSYPERPLSVDFDPINSHLLVGFRDGAILLWSLDGQLIKEIKAHPKRVNCVAFAEDGNYFFTASNDYQIKLWSTRGDLLKSYKGYGDFVNSLAIDQQGNSFVSGGQDGMVKLWKQESKVSHSLKLENFSVSSLCYAPQGKSIAIGAGRSDVYQGNWKIRTGHDTTFPILDWNPKDNHLDTLGLFETDVTAIAVSPDGQYYMAGGWDGRVSLWPSGGKELRLPEEKDSTVWAVEFMPDGSGMIAAKDGMEWENTMGLIFFWDLKGQPLDTFTFPTYWVNDVALSPQKGEKLLLMACTDGPNGAVYLYNLITEEVKTLELKGRIARSVAFSRDGQYFAFGESGRNAQIYVYDTQTLESLKFEPEARFPTDNRTGGRAVTDIAFSPDGRYVLAGAEGGLVKMFDIELKGQEILSIEDAEGHDVTSLDFSPEGTFMVIGSRNGKARIYPNLSTK